MTDIKRPDASPEAVTHTSGGVSVVRRKIRTIGIDATATTAPTSTSHSPAATPSEPPAPSAHLSGHVLTFDASIGEGGDEHTMYSSSAQLLSATAEVAVDLTDDASLLDERTFVIVDAASPVLTAAPSIAAPKVQRLITGMDVSLRPASEAELANPNFIQLHENAILAAQHLKIAYARIYGQNSEVSTDTTFQVPRHINLRTSEGRSLSVQVRIKPFGNRIEVAFILMERAPKTTRRATFMPMPNPPVCFSFPKTIQNQIVMVSGDANQPWLGLALDQFVVQMRQDPNVLLEPKIRA